MAKRKNPHLYRGSPQHRGAVLRSFEKRYGKTKGPKVYGAVIRTVKMEQLSKRGHR